MRVGRTQGLGAGGRGAYLADGGMKSHTWTPACVDASTARTMPCHLLVPGRRHEALTKAHAAECTSRPSQSCLSSAQGSSPAGYEAGRTRQDRTGHDRQAGTELRRVSPTGTALRAASSPVSCFFFSRDGPGGSPGLPSPGGLHRWSPTPRLLLSHWVHWGPRAGAERRCSRSGTAAPAAGAAAGAVPHQPDGAPSTAPGLGAPTVRGQCY